MNSNIIPPSLLKRGSAPLFTQLDGHCRSLFNEMLRLYLDGPVGNHNE